MSKVNKTYSGQKELTVLADNIPEIIFSLDRDFLITSLNDACEKFIGVKAGEILGTSYHNFKFNKGYESIAEIYREVMEKKIPRAFESEYILEGRKFFFNISAFPTKNGLIVYLRDNSAEKNAVQALIESEEKLSAVINNAEDYIFIKDKSLKYILVNNAMCSLFNKDMKDLIGCRDDVLFGEESARHIEEVDLKVLKGEVIREEPAKSVNGALRVFDTIKFPLRNSEGKITGICGISRDITEKKEIEKALKKSEERLNLAFEGAEIALWDQNFQKDEIYRSSKWWEMLGYDSSEIKETRDFWKSIVHPDDWKKIEEKVYAHEKGLLPSMKVEHRLKCKSGEYKWILNWGKIFERDENGKPIRASGIHLDINDRKLTEINLKESEEKFKMIIDNMNESLFIVDFSGTLLFVNQKALEEIKLDSFEQIIGHNMSEFLHPDSIQAAMDDLLKISKGEKTANEYCFFDSKGNAGWAEGTGSRCNYQGKEADIVILRNITERKIAEETLRLSEEKYKHLTENSSDVIWTIDNNFNYTYVSPSIYEQRGFKQEEFLKLNFDEVYSKESLNIVNESISFYLKQLKEKKIKRNFNTILELEHRCKDGSFQIGEVHMNVLVSKDSKLKGIHGITRNITKRKLAEEQLIKAKERAEELSKLKTSFFANMSHEIRTPLNGILGFSEIILEENDVDEIKRMAAIINSSGKRLLETLNLILDLSRLEANIDNINSEKIDVVKIAKETVELYTAEADKKKIELLIDAEMESLITYSDNKIIRNTLNNLVNNALKYTDKGSIKVKVTQEIITGKEWIMVDVIDTGIGIDEKYHDIIFDEFRQASEGYGRKFEGTGLGLSICRKYMKLLGGKISLKSKMHEGSDFRIEIPKLSSPGKKNKKDSSVQDTAKEVVPVVDNNEILSLLYIDDDKTSVDIMESFLKNRYDVDYSMSAVGGLAKANENNYSLILVDINLGFGMDGLEFAKRIKQIPKYKNTPLIAVTAYALQGDRERFLSENIEYYISKPYTRNEILELINGALKKK